MNGNTVKERIIVLETKIDRIDKKLDALCNNHLVHLEERLEKIELNQAKFIGYVVGAVAIIEIVIKIFL